MKKQIFNLLKKRIGILSNQEEFPVFHKYFLKITLKAQKKADKTIQRTVLADKLIRTSRVEEAKLPMSYNCNPITLHISPVLATDLI